MFHFLPWQWKWYSDVDRNNFWLIRKPFKSNIIAVFVGWTSHSVIGNSEESEISFIYDRFGGNCLAEMLEKSTSDGTGRGKPARKNMYHHYSAILSSRFDILPAWSHSRSFNGGPTFACSLIAAFSFLIRFLELVHGHFHGLGLFIP